MKQSSTNGLSMDDLLEQIEKARLEKERKEQER